MNYLKESIVVVLPAYNAGKTIIKTIKTIPPVVSQIIVVDDYSNDDTISKVQQLKDKRVKLYRHQKNLGYGGNQKTCYQLALKTKAAIVAMIHPDYQYDPTLVPTFAELITKHQFDIMLGTRIRSRKEALEANMPLYKYYANRALTLFQNIVTGQNLSEWHTGLRVYRRSALQRMPFTRFSNSFVFDTQLLLWAVKNELIIGEISIPARYFPDSSSINFMESLKYGVSTVWETILFALQRKKTP